MDAPIPSAPDSESGPNLPPSSTETEAHAGYQQGDALREAFGTEGDGDAPRLTLADVLDDPDTWNLSWDEYWNWVAQLIRPDNSANYLLLAFAIVEVDSFLLGYPCILFHPPLRFSHV